jgi:tetratricopeptide (TPR) repeat protein
VGVATLLVRGGQSLNFAVPGEVAKSIVPDDPKSVKVASFTDSAKQVSEDDKRLMSDPDFRRVFDEVKQDDHARAISTLKSLIARHPNVSNRHQLERMLMYQYEAIGFYDKVEPFRQREVELNPSSWGEWEELGDLYVKEGKYEPALAAYRQAILCFEQQGKKPTTSPLIARLIGDLYRKAGAEEKASQWLKRSEALKSGKLEDASNNRAN